MFASKIPPSAPTEVLNKALNSDAAQLRAKGESKLARQVEEALLWKKRSVAQALHQRVAGAAAVSQRISGRNAVVSDMSLGVFASRNF